MKITVKDVNDNPPMFVDAPYSGAVLENASLGMTVMRVTAVDKDEVMVTCLFIYARLTTQITVKRDEVMRKPGADKNEEVFVRN